MPNPRKVSSVCDEMLSDGSMVLFHADTNWLVTLNPTAALVWEYCDGRHSEDAIADELGTLFPGQSLQHDVAAILTKLQSHGLVGEA